MIKFINLLFFLFFISDLRAECTIELPPFFLGQSESYVKNRALAPSEINDLHHSIRILQNQFENKIPQFMPPWVEKTENSQNGFFKITQFWAEYVKWDDTFTSVHIVHEKNIIFDQNKNPIGLVLYRGISKNQLEDLKKLGMMLSETLGISKEINKSDLKEIIFDKFKDSTHFPKGLFISWTTDPAIAESFSKMRLFKSDSSVGHIARIQIPFNRIALKPETDEKEFFIPLAIDASQIQVIQVPDFSFFHSNKNEKVKILNEKTGKYDIVDYHSLTQKQIEILKKHLTHMEADLSDYIEHPDKYEDPHNDTFSVNSPENKMGENIEILESLYRSQPNLNPHFIDLGPYQLKKGFPKKLLAPDQEILSYVKEGEGYSEGVWYQNKKGKKYFLKKDLEYPELQTGAEVVSSGIYDALGYKTPKNIIVYDTLGTRLVASPSLGENLKHSTLDQLNTSEFRQLRIFAAYLKDWDRLSTPNNFTLPKNKFILFDFGGTLGSRGVGLHKEGKAFSDAIGSIENTSDAEVILKGFDLNFLPPSHPWNHLTHEDKRGALKKLKNLSDNQIIQFIKNADYSDPKDSQYLQETLIHRRDGLIQWLESEIGD